ncbi:MAG: tRNA lysidine(34) synthetase TilS, partial [Firmicutes bacterium]|nr:tRNA lysidine(34) synthetase TilS [Bacillota bacterium]
MNRDIIAYVEEQVQGTIQRYALLEQNEKVLLAVSGGPDSLCLLYVFSSLAQKLKVEPFVVTFDHGLRSEAKEEVEYVCQKAEELGLFFVSKRIDVHKYQKKYGLSPQDAARRLRYSYLQHLASEVGAQKVATGHHRDDQAETVLLNFLRGAALDGLAGMRPKRPLSPGGAILIRPLIELSRKEIEDYCCQLGVEPVTDRSNLEKVYRRNKIRLELIPYLEENFNPNLKERIAVQSRILARERDYLDAQAQKIYFLLLKKETEQEVILDSVGFCVEHPAMQFRLLRFILRRLCGGAVPGITEEHLQETINLIKVKKPNAKIDLPGISVKKRYGELILSLRGQEQERKKKEGGKLKPIVVEVPGKTFVPGMDYYLETSLASPTALCWPPRKGVEAYLDYRKLQNPLKICSRWPGARFRPLGMQGTKKLKDYYMEQKIPVEEREPWPLLVAGEKIAWVMGKEIAEDFRITAETVEVLVVRIV